MANTYELIVKTVDQSSRSIQSIERSLVNLERTGKSVTSALRTVGAAAVAVASGSVIRGVIDQYRSYERYRTVLTTFLGTQEKANQELARLTQLANTLPQDLEDVTQAFVIFTRNGLNTSSQALTNFSNIATANGKSLSQLGEAVADALTGEFERLKEFGIKVSRENGNFVARIGDQQVALAGTTTDLVKQLEQLGETRFAGAAAANASTLDQSFSNLAGAIFEVSVAFGEGLRPALKQALDDTTALLQANKELATTLGVGTGEAIQLLATSVKFLADNFSLIKDAALALIFVRIAGSVATFVGSIARAVAAAKTLTGVSSGLGKVFARLVSGTTSLIGRLTGLSTAFRAFAQLTPIGRAISLAITAAAGAMFLFRNSTIQVGNTTTNLGEILRATWFGLKTVISGTASVISTVFNTAVSTATSLFETFGIDIGTTFSGLGRFILDFANGFIGAFVLINRSIVGVFTELPGFFIDLFTAIGTTALDFGSRIVTQFFNIGEAIGIALESAFTDATLGDALDKLTENAFAGFGDEVRDNFRPVVEELSLAGEEVSNILGRDYIGEGLRAAGTAIEDLVVDYREYRTELEATNQANSIAAVSLGSLRGYFSDMGGAITTAVAALTPFQTILAQVDTEIAANNAKVAELTAILREASAAFANGSINAQQYAAVIANVGNAAGQAGVNIQTLDTVLANAISTGQQNAQTQELNAEALAYVNANSEKLGLTGEALKQTQMALGMEFKTVSAAAGGAADAIETVNSTYERSIKAIKDYELNNKNVSGAMQRLESDFASGKITLEQFRVGMEGMGAGMDNITTRSTAMALSLTDAFASAGDGLARGLARGIVQGESILSNFKNFMSSIFEEILYQIIQQAFIKPLISSISGGLSSAFSAFAGGGTGAFGGGLFGGGLFGIFGSLLGGIFGFANGGVVPGLSTAGDSVPAMLTPGEVVLNKGQQAALLNEGVNNGEAVTVNFNINAIDSRSGTEFILNNRAQITGVVQQAFNQRGRQGPLG